MYSVLNDTSINRDPISAGFSVFLSSCLSVIVLLSSSEVVLVLLESFGAFLSVVDLLLVGIWVDGWLSLVISLY